MGALQAQNMANASAYPNAPEERLNTIKAADAIIGKWLTNDKSVKVHIFKHKGKYYGKLVWGQEKNRKDTLNPDEKLRSRYLLNAVILHNFVYDNDGTWSDGTIYDPKSGKTYSSYLSLQTRNTLEVRGYMGINILGKTSTWSRTK